MAKAILAPILDGLSGKISNVVFQRNPAGFTARKRVKPSNPQTAAQSNVRSILTTVSQAWRGITEAQRTEWDTAAASAEWTQIDSYGNPFQLSGEQLYVKLNTVITILQETPITSPPAKATFDSITLGAFTATVTGTVLTIAYTGTLSSNFQFIFSASPTGSAGQMSFKSTRFSQILITTGSSPIDLSTAYGAVWGEFETGLKIWLKVQIASDLTGEVIDVGVTSTIVTA